MHSPDLFNPNRCRCESCAPGDSAQTYTRKFRAACELRWIAALDVEAQERYLGLVEKHRGINAATWLREKLWKELSA